MRFSGRRSGAQILPYGGPPSLLEQKLIVDILLLVFEHLPVRGLGVAMRTCKTWHRLLASHSSVWRHVAVNAGLLCAPESADAASRVAAAGGWKPFLQDAFALEHRWSQRFPRQARWLGAGHEHWVPAIIVEPQTQQLVTCSYDGTIKCFFPFFPATVCEACQVLQTDTGCSHHA